MSGNSKFGRGTGRGASRLVAPPPPLGRGMAMQPLRRQSMGLKEKREGSMGKGRLGNPSNDRVAMPPSQEESFQLLQEEGVRPFAMAIRLTPELLNDLKRVESQGGACLMKFGGTPAGHHAKMIRNICDMKKNDHHFCVNLDEVIKIGDEEFKFASAPEPGDLCDIFEEQRQGEDGNGVLREAGSVWRKLSVLRTLNASEKDRVKNRSKEAEQKQKSRKAIILDPNHSLVNNQNAVSGDVNGRRAPIKTKKEPPKKKQKVAASSPAAAPVPVSAPAPAVKLKPTASTASVIASAKAAKAASVAIRDLPPTPVRASAVAAPLSKGRATAEEAPLALATGRSTSVVQKDSTPSPTTTTPETGGPVKTGGVVSAVELRNCLITLLTENPKGMTIKAVEKALGEAMPHVKPERKTIEKAIKAIASYHAPGKYMLKEGVSFAKPSPGSASSPDNAAADTPPLVDSPPLPDMNGDATTTDPVNDTVHPGESGLLGDRPGASHNMAPGRTSSVVQKSNESAMSRAIRKANESYLKSQPPTTDSIKSSKCSQSQKLENGSAKEQPSHGHEAGPDAEQISIGGDESPGRDVIEGESQLDLNVDLEEKGGDESTLNSPKAEVKPANSGRSDSSSSSDSSDSDSDSGDSSDSHSASSGSGSDSDSDGSSSSASEDENMDEDVEIMSEDEEGAATGDAPHGKGKAKDKKQASRQAKEQKRAKLKLPDKALHHHDSEEVDIGGDEAVDHLCADQEEKIFVVVENLDVKNDVEVDVISMGGAGSPHESGSVSPAVSQRRSVGSLKEPELNDPTHPKPVPVKKQEVGSVRSGSDSDQSFVESRGAGSGARAFVLSDKNENRDFLQSATAGENIAFQPKEGSIKTAELHRADRQSSLGKAIEAEKSRPITLKGRINGLPNNRLAKDSVVNTNSKLGARMSPVHNNRRLPPRESPAHSASPSRPETGVKSLLGSPALRRDGGETSPQPIRENITKRRGNPEFRKSFSKEAEIASKAAKDFESEELADKIVEAPNRPWPRSNKGGDLINRTSKQIDRPQQPQTNTDFVSRNSEAAAKRLRESEPAGAAGRDTEGEGLPTSARPVRDGDWRHNPDAGLLGKPGKNVEFLGRPLNRESEPNNMFGHKDAVMYPRQPKNVRRPNNEPEATRRNESVRETDSWGKVAKDMDTSAKFGNEGEVPNNRLREGKKEPMRQEPTRGFLKVDANGGVNRQSEEKGRESPDLELGELREGTPGVEQRENWGRDGARVDQVIGREGGEATASTKPFPNKSQGSPVRDRVRNVGRPGGDMRKPSPGNTTGDSKKPSPRNTAGDLRKPSPGKIAGDLRRPSPVKTAGDLRRPSPGKTGGDLRKPSPGKASGDLRRPSPATTHAQKLAQVAQKELQKSDPIVPRDTSRLPSGSGKSLPSSQPDEKLDGNLGRNGEPLKNRPGYNDIFDRPPETRGVKRPLEESSNPEAARVYKKPSNAPGAPSSSLSRGHPDNGLASRTEKKHPSPDLVGKHQSVELGRGGSLEGPSNVAGPSGKAATAENGRKQRPFGKGQDDRESVERPKGQNFNRNGVKTSAGLLGPGGEKQKETLIPDQGQSNGKWAKPSSRSPDEITGREYYSEYEKNAPELKGPAETYEQADDYKREYQEKYRIYHQLYHDIDRNKGQFASFKKEMDLASTHPDKLQRINNKVRRKFLAVRQECKRMQRTFDVLHEELQTIKQHLKSFAEKAGQG